ncbi:MAG: hypothetical protein ACRDFX_02350 [Chloroflexota bacterium]
MTVKVGDRIVVRTPDQRAFFGELIELRSGEHRDQGVVRLDTGWVTTYPLSMIHPRDEIPREPGPDQ